MKSIVTFVGLNLLPFVFMDWAWVLQSWSEQSDSGNGKKTELVKGQSNFLKWELRDTLALGNWYEGMAFMESQPYYTGLDMSADFANWNDLHWDKSAPFGEWEQWKVVNAAVDHIIHEPVKLLKPTELHLKVSQWHDLLVHWHHHTHVWLGKWGHSHDPRTVSNLDDLSLIEEFEVDINLGNAHAASIACWLQHWLTDNKVYLHEILITLGDHDLWLWVLWETHEKEVKIIPWVKFHIGHNTQWWIFFGPGWWKITFKHEFWWSKNHSTHH